MASSNILHMRLNDTQGTIKLNHSIPRQDLVLKDVRVEMASTLDSENNPVLYVSFSDAIFGPSQINNTDTGSSYLPVFNNRGLVNHYQPTIEIGTQITVKEAFRYTIYTLAGAVLDSADFESIDLIFNYKKGGIV